MLKALKLINIIMIEYLYTEDKIGDKNTPIPVRYAGKRVGTIKPVEGGWQYFPLNHKHGGEIYTTIGLVQKSLEFSDED
jgi:hypothetical protein